MEKRGDITWERTPAEPAQPPARTLDELRDGLEHRMAEKVAADLRPLPPQPRRPQ